MANPIAFLARRNAKRVADFAVSNPLIRWVWTGPGNEDYASALSEFRPTDRESVLEMMQGRYLLASKLVDTNGVSPFAVEMVHDDWLDDLQAFAWLRHFRDARSDEERGFARSLTLDWIEANPDEATTIMAEQAQVSVEEYQDFESGTTLFSADDAVKAFEDRAGDPTSLPEMARRINPFLVSSGLAEEEADLTGLFEPSYTEAYAEKSGS